jgi:hypothetical protein
MSRLSTLFSTILLLGLIMPLGGCGPQFTTEYEIVPPASDTGRMCANNCLLVKDQCEHSCWSQQQQCEQMSTLQENLDYMTYVAGRQAAGAPIKRDRSSFNSYRCDSGGCLDRCTQNFNVCHTNCGGRIIPHTYCTAFCDELPPPAAF